MSYVYTTLGTILGKCDGKIDRDSNIARYANRVFKRYHFLDNAVYCLDCKRDKMIVAGTMLEILRCFGMMQDVFIECGVAYDEVIIDVEETMKTHKPLATRCYLFVSVKPPHHSRLKVKFGKVSPPKCIERERST